MKYQSDILWNVSCEGSYWLCKIKLGGMSGESALTKPRERGALNMFRLLGVPHEHNAGAFTSRRLNSEQALSFKETKIG